MADTARLDTDHQHHRQLLLNDPAGERTSVVHQAAPAASAFHNYAIGLLRQAA